MCSCKASTMSRPEVRSAQSPHTPVFPVRWAKELIELRRELIGLGGEHLLFEKLDGFVRFSSGSVMINGGSAVAS